MTQLTLIDVACALCGSSDASEVAIGTDREHDIDGTFAVQRCHRCGHCYLSPRPADDALDILYPETYAPFRTTDRTPTVTARARTAVRTVLEWRDLGPRQQPSGLRVVEIGCGSGRNLRRLRSNGCTVVGIEPSPTAAAAAAADGDDGVRVLVGDDTKLDELPAGEFDLAQAFMVLEHVPDPITTLRRLHRVCRPGATLEVMVPNFAARSRRRFGSDWYPLQLPRHWHHFDAGSLQRALEAGGWGDVRVWQQPTLVDRWKSLALRHRTGRFGRLFALLTRVGGVIDLLLLPALLVWVRAAGSTRLTARATRLDAA